MEVHAHPEMTPAGWMMIPVSATGKRKEYNNTE